MSNPGWNRQERNILGSLRVVEVRVEYTQYQIINNAWGKLPASY